MAELSIPDLGDDTPTFSLSDRAYGELVTRIEDGIKELYGKSRHYHHACAKALDHLNSNLDTAPDKYDVIFRNAIILALKEYPIWVEKSNV